MKLRKNCKNWEIDFTKLEIFGLVFLLMMGAGIAVTTVYDAGSTATAIASNMTVAGTLNASSIVNTSSNFWGQYAYLTNVNATNNVNATQGTIGSLVNTLLNGTQATIATLTGTTFTDGTSTLTAGGLSGLTTLNSTGAKFTAAWATLLNATNVNATVGNVSQATIATLTGTTLTDGTATLTGGVFNATAATIATLEGTTANIATGNVVSVNATTLNATGTLNATFGTVADLDSTTGRITNVTTTDLNVSETAIIPTVMIPNVGVTGQLYYNSTFDCLAYYNSTDWKCSNGTVLVG